MTTGNHIWDKREALAYIGVEPRLLRPLNMSPAAPGRGAFVARLADGRPLGVVNAMGRVFMPPVDNPFDAVAAAVDRLSRECRVILVDMHAEATAEKIAMGWHLDGRVAAVVGTHTHVQTADEQIFPGGTAFLCDAGFTGPQESILGREIEPVIRRFRTQTPQRFGVAGERVMLHGAIIDVDEASGHATSIRRVAEPLPAPGA
jgi:hypothetical protein